MADPPYYDPYAYPPDPTWSSASPPQPFPTTFGADPSYSNNLPAQYTQPPPNYGFAPPTSGPTFHPIGYLRAEPMMMHSVYAPNQPRQPSSGQPPPPPPPPRFAAPFTSTRPYTTPAPQLFAPGRLSVIQRVELSQLQPQRQMTGGRYEIQPPSHLRTRSVSHPYAAPAPQELVSVIQRVRRARPQKQQGGSDPPVEPKSLTTTTSRETPLEELIEEPIIDRAATKEKPLNVKLYRPYSLHEEQQKAAENTHGPAVTDANEMPPVFADSEESMESVQLADLLEPIETTEQPTDQGDKAAPTFGTSAFAAASLNAETYGLEKNSS